MSKYQSTRFSSGDAEEGEVDEGSAGNEAGPSRPSSKPPARPRWSNPLEQLGATVKHTIKDDTDLKGSLRPVRQSSWSPTKKDAITVGRRSEDSSAIGGGELGLGLPPKPTAGSSKPRDRSRSRERERDKRPDHRDPVRNDGSERSRNRSRSRERERDRDRDRNRDSRNERYNDDRGPATGDGQRYREREREGRYREDGAAHFRDWVRYDDLDYGEGRNGDTYSDYQPHSRQSSNSHLDSRDMQRNRFGGESFRPAYDEPDRRRDYDRYAGPSSRSDQRWPRREEIDDRNRSKTGDDGMYRSIGQSSHTAAGRDSDRAGRGGTENRNGDRNSSNAKDADTTPRRHRDTLHSDQSDSDRRNGEPPRKSERGSPRSKRISLERPRRTDSPARRNGSDTARNEDSRASPQRSVSAEEGEWVEKSNTAPSETSSSQRDRTDRAASPAYVPKRLVRPTAVGPSRLPSSPRGGRAPPPPPAASINTPPPPDDAIPPPPGDPPPFDSRPNTPSPPAMTPPPPPPSSGVNSSMPPPPPPNSNTPVPPPPRAAGSPVRPSRSGRPDLIRDDEAEDGEIPREPNPYLVNRNLSARPTNKALEATKSRSHLDGPPPPSGPRNDPMSGGRAPDRDALNPSTRPATPTGKAENKTREKRFTVWTEKQEVEKLGRTFVGTATMAEYELSEKKLGEGTFGIVEKATEKSTGLLVALKKLITHNPRDGISVTTVREIKILKSLHHENIVPIRAMVVNRKHHNDRSSRGEVFMVFPYMDHDLCGLLSNSAFQKNHSLFKLLFKQILEGLAYIHTNNFVHRDIKTANILVDGSGRAMIADFGLARSWTPRGSMPAHMENEYTNMVVTRWYRAPELLLGSTKYGPEIDLWSAGCVLGELYRKTPILAGDSDRDQLYRIIAHCGPLNEDTWPGWSELPGFPEAKDHPWNTIPQERSIVETAVRDWGMEACAADLMGHLLRLDPAKRFTAFDALDHPWFWIEPKVAEVKEGLISVESSHEFTTRRADHVVPLPITKVHHPAPVHKVQQPYSHRPHPSQVQHLSQFPQPFPHQQQHHHHQQQQQYPQQQQPAPYGGFALPNHLPPPIPEFHGQNFMPAMSNGMPHGQIPGAHGHLSHGPVPVSGYHNQDMSYAQHQGGQPPIQALNPYATQPQHLPPGHQRGGPPQFHQQPSMNLPNRPSISTTNPTGIAPAQSSANANLPPNPSSKNMVRPPPFKLAPSAPRLSGGGAASVNGGAGGGGAHGAYGGQHNVPYGNEYQGGNGPGWGAQSQRGGPGYQGGKRPPVTHDPRGDPKRSRTDNNGLPYDAL